MPQFGYCLPIFANPGAPLFRTPNYRQLDAPTTLELGRYGEKLGFDSLWVADHLMLGLNEAILEGWTTLSVLAGATKSARLGLIHQAHYFRAPAVAAKMAATLDQLSEGRLTIFYDFGQQPREHHAYHLPYPLDVDTRADQTVEGIRLMLELWQAEGPVTSDGEDYAVTNAVCNPGPVQHPHPPIWFGETQPALLRACAEFGQGWNSTPVPVHELQRRVGLLNEACEAAKRPFDTIEKSVELQVLITPNGDTESILRQIVALNGDQLINGSATTSVDSIVESLSDTTLIGSPDQVTEQVQAYVDVGIDHFLLWFLDAPDPLGMETFAKEVAPRLR